MTALKLDEETGEIMSIGFNSETGEEELALVPALTAGKQKTFKIPSTFYTKQSKKERMIPKKLDCSPTAATAFLFLLPTSILFYPVLGVLVVTIEVIIHIWAHRKNRQLKGKNRYYQSPLHVICQEFCGSCKEHNNKLKVSKIHEKRADKIKKYGLQYVRRVVT